ncbi:MAG: hypothetical protein RLZZ436_2153 [Planctomycetota bacterium]
MISGLLREHSAARPLSGVYRRFSGNLTFRCAALVTHGRRVLIVCGLPSRFVEGISFVADFGVISG